MRATNDTQEPKRLRNEGSISKKRNTFGIMLNGNELLNVSVSDEIVVNIGTNADIPMPSAKPDKIIKWFGGRTFTEASH